MMSPKERERVFGYVKILEAYLDGKEIQYNDGGGWITLSIQPHFNFASEGQYRVKPRPRVWNVYVCSDDSLYTSKKLIPFGVDFSNINVREVLYDEQSSQ